MVIKVQEIQSYISKNKEDDPGSWEYGHTPYLTDILSGLNEKDSELFSIEVLNWSEYHMFEMADPIIFCDNNYLENDFLYIQIFSKIKNDEYLEYLVENVIWTIKSPHYTEETVVNWNTDLIINLKSNIMNILPIKGDGWQSLIEVINFLDNVIEKRRNHG